jgi:phytoene synthase
VSDPDTSLARRGSSFALAARLLPAATASDVGRLYTLCRTVDDLADRDGSPAARRRLARIRAELAGAPPRDPVARAFNALAHERGFALAYARDLVTGVEGDLEPVRLATVGDLLVYAYRVAGTVGAMMAPTLGATDADAVAPAVDLGIAMQLTNIARDVLEDARADRRYLPAAWVDLPPAAIAEAGPAARGRVPAALLEVLALADRYYARGHAGLAHLPPRARTTVAVAADLYRAIGTVLRERDGAYWRGRAVVGKPRRWAVAARAAVGAGGPVMVPSPAPAT